VGEGLGLFDHELPERVAKTVELRVALAAKFGAQFRARHEFARTELTSIRRPSRHQRADKLSGFRAHQLLDAEIHGTPSPLALDGLGVHAARSPQIGSMRERSAKRIVSAWNAHST